MSSHICTVCCLFSAKPSLWRSLIVLQLQCHLSLGSFLVTLLLCPHARSPRILPMHMYMHVYAWCMYIVWMWGMWVFGMCKYVCVLAHAQVCAWMYMYKCQYMHVKTCVCICPHLPPCLTQGFFVVHHCLEEAGCPESFWGSSCLCLIASLRSTH